MYLVETELIIFMHCYSNSCFLCILMFLSIAIFDVNQLLHFIGIKLIPPQKGKAKTDENCLDALHSICHYYFFALQFLFRTFFSFSSNALNRSA